ncbi:hypothetical protein [Nitratireductor pacificus]|uniref:Uncharacterized protein n=1 Tax=Nitratireductor pacificus pht-3B TaxID=391937 RepID=K2N8V5_9HYPH|nr:hypothetical protein [Nitratireductor pacificus]EKF20538.1 hypothetical protein NA2_02099 [Nitratireductor pacificus pht-3B]
MRIDMASSRTLIVLALTYGIVTTIPQWLSGKEASDLIISFLGNAIGGPLIALLVAFLVLAPFGKRHLLRRVANWLLVALIAASIGGTAVIYGILAFRAGL